MTRYLIISLLMVLAACSGGGYSAAEQRLVDTYVESANRSLSAAGIDGNVASDGINIVYTTCLYADDAEFAALAADSVAMRASLVEDMSTQFGANAHGAHLLDLLQSHGSSFVYVYLNATDARPSFAITIPASEIKAKQATGIYTTH